tara:strand:+ start:36513 stop:37244 length:732 start_codon:yes stop_codon:yes gene_type:complete
MLNSLSSLKKIILLIYFLIFNTSIFLLWQILSKADLPINEIMIKGQYDSIDNEQIHLIANEYLIGNFFTVNLKSTQNAFKKLPWVRDVSVRRKWPDKLLITIEEHNVLARWGNLGLINNYGEIFNAAFQDDLPVFNGDEKYVMDITKKYYEINKILSKELIQIGTISLSGRLSWEIVTDNQLKIILGQDNVLKKLNLFITHYQDVLYKVKKRIDYVDLRYKDGFSVKVINESKRKFKKEKIIL